MMITAEHWIALNNACKKVEGYASYEANAEVAATRAREKSEIKFVRDPANQYDSNAVRVILAQIGAFGGTYRRSPLRNGISG